MVFSLLSGCATKPNVMVIDEMNIPQGIYAYYYGYSYANFYSTYGETGVKYYTMTSVYQHVAVSRLFDQYGLKLTDEDKDTIEQLRAAKIEELGGQEVYVQFLKLLGLTDKLYREILSSSPKYTRVMEYLYGEGGPEHMTHDEIRAAYAEVCAHEVHIYISTEDVETAEDQDALMAKAEEAHAKAIAGEDFAQLMKDYGDDEYLKNYPEAGYYLIPGDSGNDAVDAVLFSLEIGEISEIVTTDTGFLIYKRLPVMDDYLDAVFNGEAMYDGSIENAFGYYLMDVMTDYSEEYLPAFYEVDFSLAYAAFGTSSTTAQ
jgi:hypothetical protein